MSKKYIFLFSLLFISSIFKTLYSQTVSSMQIGYLDIHSLENKSFYIINIDKFGIHYFKNRKRVTLNKNHTDSVRKYIMNMKRKTIIYYLDIADSISDNYNKIKITDTTYFFYNKSFIFSIKYTDGSLNKVLLNNAYFVNRNNLNPQEVFINWIFRAKKTTYSAVNCTAKVNCTNCHF